MRLPDLSPDEFKRGVDRALKRLNRDGVSVTFQQMLESSAAFWQQRDWNTLSAALVQALSKHKPSAASKDRISISLSGIDVDRRNILAGPDGKAFIGELVTVVPDDGHQLCFGNPGSGKSMWMDAESLRFCGSPENQQKAGGLPRLVTIGTFIPGTAEQVREACPLGAKNQIEILNLKFSTRHAINPFDTMLGCRFPTPSHREMIVDIFMAAFSRSMLSGIQEDTVQILRSAVDATFARFSDNGISTTPKIYAAGKNSKVDAALQQSGIVLSQSMQWWEVVDCLFLAGELDAAQMAQNHAMPLVYDLAETLLGFSREGQHGLSASSRALAQRLEGGIRIILMQYPNLTIPTSLVIGRQARVIAINVDCGRGSSHESNSACYLLAQLAATRDWFGATEGLSAALLREPNHIARPKSRVSAAYEDYHAKRLSALLRCPKQLVIDEFHLILAAPGVDRAIPRCLREGPENCVQITIGTQLLPQAVDDVLFHCKRIIIMGPPHGRRFDEMAQVLHLSPIAQDVVANMLHGPGRDGVLYLDGNETLTRLKFSSEKIWAMTTTPYDIALRQLCYASLGPVESRRLLAKRFPQGSARSEIERRVNKASGLTREVEMQVVIEEILAEILRG